MVKLKQTCIWMMVLLVFSVTMFSGCEGENGTGPQGRNGQQKTVQLAYVNWAEGVALTHLMTCILEDMGYNVELTMADVAPIYAAISQGDQDIMMETWMPVTHQTYWEKYQEDFDVLGTWFDNARIGLVVPAYVEVNSIASLNEHKDKFDSEIVGIDAGAGIMENTEKAIDQYGLEYELVASSGPAMTAALKSAIDKNEPVIVTGWAPHWKFARYDLKFLEDPKGVYGSVEQIRFICRKGFKEDMPKVAALFANISFEGEQIASLMDAVSNAEGSEQDAARDWMKKNTELVQSWKEGI